MRVVLKVRKKGILVLPKALRESIGIEENSEVIAEVVDNSIVIKPLRPRIVEIERDRVEEIIREERREWEERIDRITRKTCS